MAKSTHFDVIMIGHFAKDRNIVDGHGKTESGGGVYFGSVVLKCLSVNVAILTLSCHLSWNKRKL